MRVSVCDGGVNDREFIGVGGVSDGPGARLGDHVLEAEPVILVAVGSDHSGQPSRPDELKQSVRLVRRVDEELLSGRLAPQQVCVVVHRSDRNLGDHEVGQLPYVGRPTFAHLAGVGHIETLTERRYGAAPRESHSARRRLSTGANNRFARGDGGSTV